MVQNTPPTDLLGLILRRWWVLALGVVVGLGIALLGLRVVAPSYEATATQLIKGVPGSGTGAPYLAAQFAVARAKSYPAFIYSAAVLDDIRSDLGDRYTDTRLREQLSASNPVDTPLVNITATGETPQEAQNLANSASRHLARFITQIETVGGSTPVIVETAVQAGLPTTPATPRPPLYIALGLSGGLALGAIALLSWRMIEDRSPQRRARIGRRQATDDDALVDGSSEATPEPPAVPADTDGSAEPHSDSEPTDDDEPTGDSDGDAEPAIDDEADGESADAHSADTEASRH